MPMMPISRLKVKTRPPSFMILNSKTLNMDLARVQFHLEFDAFELGRVPYDLLRETCLNPNDFQ
jgi:hypothetical protein